MKAVHEFILNNETILFYPQRDEFGNLVTGVMEEHRAFLVDSQPSDLVDYHLKHYGTSLQGASDGTKMILGRISMRPIVMNEKLGWYWFPSESPSSADCVWFSLHHIKDYNRIDEKKTLVTFSNGSTIIIDVSVTSFDKKVQRAYKLKGKVEGRTRESDSQYTESYTIFHLNKKSQSINYEINSSRHPKGMKRR